MLLLDGPNRLCLPRLPLDPARRRRRPDNCLVLSFRRSNTPEMVLMEVKSYRRPAGFSGGLTGETWDSQLNENST